LICAELADQRQNFQSCRPHEYSPHASCWKLSCMPRAQLAYHRHHRSLPINTTTLCPSTPPLSAHQHHHSLPINTTTLCPSTPPLSVHQHLHVLSINTFTSLTVLFDVPCARLLHSFIHSFIHRVFALCVECIIRLGCQSLSRHRERFVVDILVTPASATTCHIRHTRVTQCLGIGVLVVATKRREGASL